MPKASGTFTRERVMLVTDDGADAITDAIDGLAASAREAGFHVQVRKLATQTEFRFVTSEKRLVKAALTPAEKAAAARRAAIKAISRTLGREVTAEEYDGFLAKFGTK